MKKLVMTVAVLACAASIVSAQTVTSANMVGYNKAPVGSGLQIMGTAFDDVNTVDSIFGDSLPANTIVSTYAGGVGYAQSKYTVNFIGVGSWSDPDLDIGISVGYWVDLPSGQYTNIISGEVVLDNVVTNTIETGLQLLSFPYPVETTVSTAGFTPVANDIVSTYVNGVGYAQSKYTINFIGVGSWSDPNLPIQIGQGFWYDSQGVAYDWIVTRPFTP